jgi:dihydrolipoamide dehydrogenase
VYHTVETAAEFGVAVGEHSFDWSAALGRTRGQVEERVKGLSGLLHKRGVEVIDGFGRIAGDAVAVDLGGGEVRTLETRSIILATGSGPRTIPGYEFDGFRIVTSDHALFWEERPGRVAVIGAGAIGCEFASLLVDVGSEVHLFEVMDQIVPGMEPKGAQVLQRALAKRGVTIRTGVEVGPAEVHDSGVTVPFGEESVEVDAVLVAVGRMPHTEGLGLEATPVHTERGFVPVDSATMQTADPRIYAVGDIVAGTPQLAHAAFAEAIAAVTHIATGETAPVDYRAIPAVVYTHPEAASVGMTAAEAEAAGLEIEATTTRFLGARAAIIGEPTGFIQILAEQDGPIVGATVVGSAAGELIHELMYAVAWEALPAEAARFIHAHPTLAEAIGETLLTASGKSLH